MSTQKSKSANHAATKEPTVQPTVSITEMLIREASAKAQAEAEAMRLNREERERQRIAAERQAAINAEREKKLEAERKAAAERQRVAAIEAAKLAHQREIVKWEATYKIHAALGELLERLMADTKRTPAEREFMIRPDFLGHDRHVEEIQGYIKYALQRTREVLISGKTA